MSRLSLSLLGPLQINLDSKPVTGFESVKSKALLAYLAEEPGRAHSRSMLAGLLWSERPDNAALNNLRHVLANLRQVIHDPDAPSPFLLIDRESVALNLHNDCLIDTLCFRQMANTAADPKQPAATHLSHLEQADSLYRGEFLETFPQGKTPVFEEWVLVRREFYRSQFLEVLNKLAEISLSQGDYERVKDYTRRQLEIEPWREEAHCQMMETLAQEGNRCEALTQYSVCCSVLKKELNVEPSPTTIQLFERIRDGSLSSLRDVRTKPVFLTSQQIPLAVFRHPQVHHLPRSLTSFIGREDEITRLQQLIHDHYLVMLTGPGGVGKSRLALEVARQLLGEFRDGVWFVELASRDHPNEVISAVYRALGLCENPVQPTLEELVNYLGNQQILLVLDNCEHLLKACAEFVYALLQACPELRVLATSREKLGLAGEEIVRVPLLEFPDTQLLPALENYLDYAAVRLLVDRAQAIQPLFQVTVLNLPSIASICKGLDGIPLAIELAVSHLDLLTIEQLASRLNGSFQLLSGNDRLALPRHQIYRETINWSYQLLSEKERLLLQRLSIFDGGFTLEATEAVCASEGITRSEIFSLLTGLVDKSMLLMENPPKLEMRFRPLNTIQQYALEKLRLSGDEKRLRASHCAYYLHLAEVARPRMRTGEHLAWIRKLDTDRDNLLSAIHWAIDEEYDIPVGLQMLYYLDDWWSSRCLFERVLMWLRKGLAAWACSPISTNVISLRVEALCLLAKIETNRDVALSLVGQALTLAQELGVEDHLKLGLAFQTAGFLFRSWYQNPILAYAFAYEALRIYQKYYPKKSWEVGRLLEAESMTYLLLRDYPRAAALARESWEVFQDIGDRWYSNSLSILGAISLEQGDYCQARTYIEEALAQKAEGEDAEELEYLELFGRLEREQGNYPGAIARLRQAIRHSSQHFFYAYSLSLLQELAYTEIKFSRGRHQSENEQHLLHASRLLGAAEACSSYEGLRVFAFPNMNHRAMIKELRTRLEVSRFEKAWKEGGTMSFQQASAYAQEYPLAG
jgi:predicted ATPase/DNA-binding SARP family transcriptional activator